MHASIWKFVGNPDELLPRYDAMVAEIPVANLRLHLCLRTADGIVLVDTCPTREVFQAFVHGEGFRSLRARHGFPEPVQVDDFPVLRGFAEGGPIHWAAESDV
jgi:hypothetical protein